MSNAIKMDKDYKKWIEEVGRRFRHSQIKAASSVNFEMLRFYYAQRQALVYLLFQLHLQL